MTSTTMSAASPNASAGFPPPRVILVQHASDLSGSTISGALVAQGLRDDGWEVDVALGSDGNGAALYERLGCEVHVVPHRNWLRSDRVAGALRRMALEWRASGPFARLIDQRRPDLVYVNSLVSLAAALAARRRRIPCVWHVRELFEDVEGEMKVPPLAGKGLVRRVLAACADHVVLNSEAVRDNVLGAGWRRSCSVVHNAVGDRFFQTSASCQESRDALGLPQDELIVGVPGTLRPMKGHDFFIDAAARLVERGTRCRFVVTGDGERHYVEGLRQQMTRLGVADRIDMLGSISLMPEFYRACDLVCVPSRAEPFGRVVVEAFASGVPVVASAVGGIRETVENGKTGLLVEFGDVSGLAAAMQLLLDDAPLRRTLAAAALAKAGSCYSEQVHQKRIVSIARACIAGRKAGRR